MQQKRAKKLLRAALSGEPDALQRILALQPKPPSLEQLTLADAQLVVARGYGFENWSMLRRKLIDAGERVRPEFLPTGLDDVDAVLWAHRLRG